MTTAAELNVTLLTNQDVLRAEVESSGNSYAIGDFELSVIEAFRGETDWQQYTNSDLCAALGYCTLEYRVMSLVEGV